MKRKPSPAIPPAPLRRRAETRLREQAKNDPALTGGTRSPAETQRLLHELQVHQIELEMQNEELQRSRGELEAGLERYSDLYDFAPIAYFSMGEGGAIRQVNLTGATMVGIARHRLLGQHFGRLLTAGFRPTFSSFLKKVFSGRTKLTAEFALSQADGPPRYIIMEAQRSPDGQECRAAIVDISERKRSRDRLRLLWAAAGVLLANEDPDVMLHDLLDKIGPSLGVDAYFNYLLDATGGMRLVSYRGVPEGTARSIERLAAGPANGNGVGGHHPASPAPRPQAPDDPMARVLKTFGLSACACNPLIAGQRLLGTLCYASRSREQFDADELVVLHTISHYVALAYERRQGAAALRASEVRFRRLFEEAHDGILLLDPLTRKITDANPYITRLLGYHHEELVGKELYQIGLLKDEAASQEMFRKLTRNREVRYEDLPLESQGGRHQEVEVVANLYEEAGHLVIQCNIRNITERKMAEEALRRNEALFTALIDQAPLGVYVVDAAFRLQQVNRRARPVFNGIHPLIGRDLGEVFLLLWPKRISDPIQKQFRHTLKTGEPYREAGFSGRRRDTGALEYYDWEIERVTLPGGEFGVVAYFHDITEQKRAETTERRAAALAVANREAKQDIARRRAMVAVLRRNGAIQRGFLVESRELQTRLRYLTRQLITAQEEERKRISHELHDEVVQTLVGINVALSGLGHGAAAGEPGLQARIERTQQQVEKAVDSVHRFARELRPAVLDDLGLIPALHGFSQNLAKGNKLKIQMIAFAGVEGLAPAERTVLFRVAQEALTNVVRHAHATQVRVGLSKIPGAVRLEIHDNGKSFPVEKVCGAKNPKRLGLVGMKERLEMVGGRLTITSTRRRGTTVRAEIPFNPEKTKS